VASQVLLVGIAACAVAALVCLARVHRERALGRAERWLVALPGGLFAGWVTAAVFVGVGPRSSVSASSAKGENNVVIAGFER